jgi:hypothetical protein
MGDKAATVAYMRMKHKDPAKGAITLILLPLQIVG